MLGCFAFSPAAKADQPVVGLWQVEYTGACEPPVLPPDFFTYQQFHSDGLEFESANLFPGAHCMGTWKQMGHWSDLPRRMDSGWYPGVPTSVRFVFTETLTVSNDRNSYDGSVDETFYDAPVGGNAVAHCTSTTHARRISVNQSNDAAIR